MIKRLDWLRIKLERRWFVVFSFSSLKILLELGYWVFISPSFAYAGFVWSPDLLKYFESWILLTFFVLLAPRRIQRPSDYMITVFLAGLILPLLSFYALGDQSRQHLYIVLLGYLVVLIFRQGPPLMFPIFRGSIYFAVAVAILGAISVSAWMIGSGGVQYFNLDLMQVYDFRRDSSEVTGRFGFQYFNVWATKVFGPLLLAIGLWKRWWLLVAAVLALHVFWFGVTAHKAVLFYPAVVIAVWFWIRKLPIAGLVPLSMSALVAISLLAYLILDYGLWASLFIRRVFYVLAHNTFGYYEFFSENPKVWWSDSVLSWLTEYPYELNPALLIGDWRGTGDWVNNSFISTGYMHAGIGGVIFYCVLVGLLFRLADSVANKGVPVWLSVAILIIPMRSLLLSSDFFTALLTHGVAVALLLLLFLRSMEFRSVPCQQDYRGSAKGGIAASGVVR